MTQAGNMHLDDPQFYDDPWQYYNEMLKDISGARESICIETYKFGGGNIGERFRDVLTRKAKEGIQINILIDSWGTQVSRPFFKKLEANGGEVRFFMKIRFFWDFFTKNHRRNHRKLLLIDDHISYIGSANIAGHSLNWCESVLRLNDTDLNKQFQRIFDQDFKMYKSYTFKKPALTRLIRSGEYEILRDVPSITRQKIKKRYEDLIKGARQRIVIETPYFLPGFLLRKAMADAVKRGVDVTVIIPMNSDVHMIDMVRGRYLGMLYKNGVNFRLYLPHNLHAKLLMVDNETFSVGSANFDYRSFRYLHEIVLIGKDERIVHQLRDHINNCLQNSTPFDYEEWLKRPFAQRFFEWIYLPFRHLL
ncbi:MAG: phosphatidylserine/phosphatidylglycerophosphate/cardiolipin synthase family protein [Bacteroidales bacterium]|nr:phosphatidylserine/phosphatidylglycerophosphate/cardiolipin synthase family protein [Bacteroidales bacterium]